MNMENLLNRGGEQKREVTPQQTEALKEVMLKRIEDGETIELGKLVEEVPEAMIPELVAKISEGSYLDIVDEIPEELQQKLKSSAERAFEATAKRLESMGFAYEANEMRNGELGEETPEMVKKIFREELSRALKEES